MSASLRTQTHRHTAIISRHFEVAATFLTTGPKYAVEGEELRRSNAILLCKAVAGISDGCLSVEIAIDWDTALYRFRDCHANAVSDVSLEQTAQWICEDLSIECVECGQGQAMLQCKEDTSK